MSVVDPQGVQTGRQIVRYTLVLILTGLMPTVLGLGGRLSGVAALLLGVAFLHKGLGFARTATDQAARQVFRSSLVFLPALLLLFVLDALLACGR